MFSASEAVERPPSTQLKPTDRGYERLFRFTRNNASSSTLPPPPLEEALRLRRACLGDDRPEIIVQKPELIYHYDQPGLYEVSLSLLGRHSNDLITIEVINCDHHLQCGALPDRPCPPGYVCDSNAGLCNPEQVDCTSNLDCPKELACDQGTCGPRGVCSGEDPDPNTNPNSTMCGAHSDCALDAFCVDGLCETAQCNDKCRESVSRSYSINEALPYLPITGVAANPLEPETWMFMSQSGEVWTHWGSFRGFPAPDDAPPQYQGLIEPLPDRSQFLAEGPNRSWVGYDIALPPDSDTSFFLSTSTMVDLNPEEPLADLLGNAGSLFLSMLSEPYPASFSQELTDTGERYLINSDFRGDFYMYSLDNLEVMMDLASEGEVISITSYPATRDNGAMICGIASDNDTIYLAENRVDPTTSEMTAARIVAISVFDGSVSYISTPLKSACALDWTEGELIQVGYNSPYVVVLSPY